MEGAAVLREEHGDTFRTSAGATFAGVCEYLPLTMDSFETGPAQRIDSLVHVNRKTFATLGIVVNAEITKDDSSVWRVLIVDSNPGDIEVKLHCVLKAA